ncbi:MAG: hypothetical protein WDN00_02060 [Limisphaerales bacterium]
MKKEVVADYHEILWECGTEPVFTLAALARKNLCTQPADSFAMLDIGDSQSELTVFEKGVPIISRIIFWGSESPSGTADGQLEVLAKTVNGSLAGVKVFISGNVISGEITAQLAKTLANGLQGERLTAGEDKILSAAIYGLKKVTEQGGEPELCIRIKQPDNTNINLASLDLKKWGVRVGALVLILLLLPYVEALVLKPHLAKKVAAFKTEAARLTVIDRELDFPPLPEIEPAALSGCVVYFFQVRAARHTIRFAVAEQPWRNFFAWRV